jgi:hypothetical protein
MAVKVSVVSNTSFIVAFVRKFVELTLNFVNRRTMVVIWTVATAAESIFVPLIVTIVPPLNSDNKFTAIDQFIHSPID